MCDTHWGAQLSNGKQTPTTTLRGVVNSSASWRSCWISTAFSYFHDDAYGHSRVCFSRKPTLQQKYWVYIICQWLEALQKPNQKKKNENLFFLKQTAEHKKGRASLVVQWLRICLPMQGTRVRALVWEDPTCHGATRPVSHNYWAYASGARAPQQERPR